jgi:hypothetical protein
LPELIGLYTEDVAAEETNFIRSFVSAQCFRYNSAQVAIFEVRDKLLITINAFFIATKMWKKNRKNHLFNYCPFFSRQKQLSRQQLA